MLGKICRLILLLLIMTLASCSMCTLEKEDLENAGNVPMEFEPGIRNLAQQVLCNMPYGFSAKTIKFGEFDNRMTGNKLKFQKVIEEIMLKEFGDKITTVLAKSELEPDYILEGSFEAGSNDEPTINLRMIHGKKQTKFFAGRVKLKQITYDVTEEEIKKAKTGFSKEEFKNGIWYIAKEILHQLKRDTYDPYKKIIHFARVSNRDPLYELKMKDKITDYMMETLNVKFTLAETTDFSKVDYVLNAYLYHDKDMGTNMAVPRLQVEVYDSRTGVRVAMAEAKFLHFNTEPLEKSVYLISPAVDSHFTENLDAQEMDRAFKIDMLAEKAFSLKGVIGREEAIIETYKNIVDMIGEDERFKSELQDAYASLFQNLYKMGKKEEAELYLKKLLVLSIENNNKINFSPRFKRGWPAFIDEETEFYRFNLKVLSEFLSETPLKVVISGHTAITDIHYANCILSKDRAEYILSILKEYQPDIAKISKFYVVGRSFIDCRICQGEDEYDRRVTFDFIGDITENISPDMLLDCLKYGKKKGFEPYDRHPNEKR